MPTITLSNGKQFLATVGEPLLDAALRADIVLEHGCRSGRCGVCKTLVDLGSTKALMDETALAQTERDAGWILSCARCACSDLQLAVADLGELKLFPEMMMPCRVMSLDKLSIDVLRVLLRLPPNQQLKYLSGQYIDVIGSGGIRRSYSIANAPNAENLIELHIRRVRNGRMSRYWFEEAKINDLLRLNGPLGTFFLRDAYDRDLIFLATGTGIAPIKAILEGIQSVPDRNMPRSIHVFWGACKLDDLYWDPVRLGLEIEYHPVLSREDSSWEGERGYVQHAALRTGIKLEDAVVYACGSLQMITDARADLTAAGLDKNSFFSDAFVSSSQ